MKSFIVFALFVAAAVAGPVSRDADAVITKYDNDNIGVGPYSWVYETNNGQTAQETGQLENVGTEAEALAVTGSFSYVGEDGITYTVTYKADRNGFQPLGAHIPVA